MREKELKKRRNFHKRIKSAPPIGRKTDAKSIKKSSQDADGSTTSHDQPPTHDASGSNNFLEDREEISKKAETQDGTQTQEDLEITESVHNDDAAILALTPVQTTTFTNKPLKKSSSLSDLDILIDQLPESVKKFFNWN